MVKTRLQRSRRYYPGVAFTDIVTEAEKLTEPEDFGYVPLVSEGFTQLRRYAPALLETLELKAVPAARDLLDGVKTLRYRNERELRKVSEDAPDGFIRKRCESVVHVGDALDRRFYELCILLVLKNALRSGDIWVTGVPPIQGIQGISVIPDSLRNTTQGAITGTTHRYPL